MPIYEYACATCGQTVEVIHGMTAAGPTTHEGCGGSLQKVASSPRMRVKPNDGLPGSTPSSILRFHENSQLAAEKSKKGPARVVSLPGPQTKAAPPEPEGG